MYLPTKSIEQEEPQSLEHLIEQLGSLPSLPMVITHALQVVEGEDQSVESLARVLEADHALTARLLHIASSAFYGASEEIHTIQDAIFVIGFDAVRSLAVSTAVVTGVWVDDELFEAARFWEHSLSCGLFAEAIAKKLGHSKPEVAFTLGVLHDIGRVVMLQIVPEHYREVITVTKTKRAYLWKVERQVLGFHHGELGARLAEKWQLPPAYSEAVRYHHEPEKAHIENELAYILSLSDAMSHHCFSGNREDRILQPLYRGMWEPLGLDEKAIREILKQREIIRERTRAFYEMALTLDDE